jgi:hypothetical protein
MSIILILKKKYFFSGIACIFSILTYNGYSAIFYTTILFSILFIINNEDKYIQKLTIYAIGISSIIILVQLVGYTVDSNYLTGLLNWMKHAHLIQQGDFGLGYKYFFVYLWETESIFLISLLIPLVLFKKLMNINHSKNIMFLGAFFSFSIFFVMILQSDVTENAVLYSRTINQILPFLSVVVGCGINYMFSAEKLCKLKLCFVFPVLLIWIYNLIPIIQMEFPKQIRQSVVSSNNKITLVSDYSKSEYNYKLLSNSKKIPKLINCAQIFPGIKYYNKQHLSDELWTVKHPYQYKPYQFMHFNEQERSLLEKYPPVIRFGY